MKFKMSSNLKMVIFKILINSLRTFFIDNISPNESNIRPHTTLYFKSKIYHYHRTGLDLCIVVLGVNQYGYL